jgi:hypothetical protein
VSAFPKVAQLKTIAALRGRLAELGVELPSDDRILMAEQGSPLAQPLKLGALETAGAFTPWKAGTPTPTARQARTR